ncbi:hypothetical protein BDL97_17G079900 [Sphagnum fallax]|nr:hypothetical protein BDL97_17G079900 [Sphagnum fallax]KAH8936334.1 hypothetical protein BDL97_17G079900 [Sphagnum fallax]
MMQGILCKLGGALLSMLSNCIGTRFHVGATPQGSTSNVVTACHISSDVDEVLVQEEAPAISKQAVNPSPRHAEASVVAPRRSKYSREIGLVHESSYYNEEEVADLAASDHATLACSSSFVVAEVVGEALTGELHATKPSRYVEEPVAPASHDAAINASGFAQDQAVSDTLRTFDHHTDYPSRPVEEVPAAPDLVPLHVKAVIPQGSASNHDTTAHNSLAVQEGQPRHFKVQVKLMHNESGFVNCELQLQLTGNAKHYESSICIIDLKDLEDAIQGKYKPVDITSGLARFDFTRTPLHAQAVAISCCAENPRPWFEVEPDLIRLLLSSCVDLEISFVTQSSEKKLRSRWWSSTPDGSRRSSMVNTLEIPSSYRMGQEAIDRFSGLFFAVLCFAWLNHMPNLVKLVVYLRPWLACPISQDQALVVSTLMKCNSMQQVAELLLKFNPSLLRSMSDQAKELFRIEEKLYKPSFLLNQNIHELAPLILLGQQYEPSILPWSKCPLNAVGKPFIFTRLAGLPRSVQDVLRCYAETVRLVHTLDKVRNKFWKFDARVSGLRSPWSTKNSKQSWQNITLEVEMECEVVPNCDLALKLSNLKFINGGFHNYSIDPVPAPGPNLGSSCHTLLCVLHQRWSEKTVNSQNLKLTRL